MPSTPGQTHDETTVDPSSVAAHTQHTTCPPEEIREQLAPREESIPAPPQTDVILDATGAHSPAFEADIRSAGADDMESVHTAGKRTEDVEETMIRDTPSPSGLAEVTKDSDTRLAQSMSEAALSPGSPQIWPTEREDTHRIPPNSSSSFLRPGSRFVGTQQSDRQVYNVQVEIKNVDMEESFLCGYLRIQGLTDDHPTLTTYFEGEIIGNKHTFKTGHAEWGSSEKVDMQHWARFPAWRPLAKSAKSSSFTFKNATQRENLFMRWKEYFLVPDHKVKTITGASFEGFYYICFNQCSGSVSGIYFHAKSEKYQQLELEHVKDRGCMGAMEFR